MIGFSSRPLFSLGCGLAWASAPQEENSHGEDWEAGGLAVGSDRHRQAVNVGVGSPARKPAVRVVLVAGSPVAAQHPTSSRPALDDALFDQRGAEFIRQRDDGGEVRRGGLVGVRPLGAGRRPMETDFGGRARADGDFPGVRPRVAKIQAAALAGHQHPVRRGRHSVGRESDVSRAIRRRDGLMVLPARPQASDYQNWSRISRDQAARRS